MKRSVIIYTLALLMCLGLVLPVRAAIVEANDIWGMVLEPDQSFTCLAHFIPEIPGIPESLIFPKAPEWTQWFVYQPPDWETVLSLDGKTTYFFGDTPIPNNEATPIYIFYYKLYYQWDDADPDYDPDYPFYLDWVAFNGSTIIRDDAWRRTGGGIWERYDKTWKEQEGGGPYLPVPEPATICLLGLGAAFCRKASFHKGRLTPLTGLRKKR